MMLAHHEVLLVVQGTASVGLAGWAAAIAARWYSITHRRGTGRGVVPSAHLEGDDHR
jgi:hypothetical protein